MTDAMTQVTQEQHKVEQAFAGAVLIGGDYARSNAGWLSPQVFTDPQIAEYWTLVLDGQDPVNAGFETGMSAQLLKWSQTVTSSLDTDKYAKALQRAAFLRFMVMGATDLVRAAQKGDEQEIGVILDTMKGMDSGVSKSMRESDDVADSLKHRISLGNISVPFGIQSMDYATGGLERGTLTILGARTSMGKSSIAFQWAEYQALTLGLKVGFFALEMSAEQMYARRVCHKIMNVSGVPASWQDVRSGQISDVERERLYTLVDEYAALVKGKLFVSDATNVTTDDMLRTQMRERYDVIYVDTMELLKDRPRKGERHDQMLGRISMGLHELAKNTKAVVIALVQLKRAVADRENKRPRMDDIQDSTKVESNADNILLLDRPSYWDGSVAEVPDPMEIIMAKYRDGARSMTAWVGFDLPGQKFVSIERPLLDDVATDKMQQATLEDKNDVPF